MKVSMINTEKSRGGAARMATLLAKTLNDSQAGVSVTLFHNENNDKDEYSHGTYSAFNRYLNAFLARVAGSTCVLDHSYAKLVNSHISDSDIMHLHNLHGYYLNWPILLKKLKNMPVIWTWHDQWPLTGRCGFAIDCDLWQSGCQSCPHMEYYPRAWIDRAHSEYQIKSESYRQLQDLYVVSPSEWLAEMAIKRGFDSHRVKVIPNPVDTSAYISREKTICRKQLGLPEDIPVILFIAADCNDPRKGYNDFTNIIKDLPVFPLVVGKEPEEKLDGIFYAGETRSKEELSLYYSAADVMVFTSRADNYPNTIIECMLCGTPVYAYAVGGVVSQLHDELCTSFVYGDIAGMRAHLGELVKTGGKTERISSTLENYAKNTWSAGIIADKYLRLYEEALGNKDCVGI